MKLALTTAALALALTGTAAAETRAIAVGAINEVKVSGRFDVEIVQGAQTSAVLEGAAEDLARVTARFQNGVLEVSEKCRVNCRRDLDVTLKVTAPALRAIQASRGVSAAATGLTAADLRLDASMGASLKANGRCTNLTAETRMGGVLEAQDLQCHVASVESAMGGVASIHADQQLTARATMGGVVDVKGAPARRDTSASMGGVIDAN